MKKACMIKFNDIQIIQITSESQFQYSEQYF